MRRHNVQYKHIVFDLDGTLIDTERAILPSLRDTLEELTGRRYEEQELTFALGITCSCCPDPVDGEDARI